MRYEVILERPAQRGLDSMQGEVYRRMVDSLRALAENPRPHGVKKLKGASRDFWRIRVGDYRIVYAIQDKRLLVIVIRIGHRSNVYN